MTQPTIPDYFGIGAEVVTTERTILASDYAPYLLVPFSGLADSGLSDPASMTDPDKVFGAILKLARVFTAADTAEESGIEVGAPRKSFTLRGNSTKLGYDYSVTVYLPDPTGAEFDPDTVI
jgi:hypothetical protein